MLKTFTVSASWNDDDENNKDDDDWFQVHFLHCFCLVRIRVVGIVWGKNTCIFGFNQSLFTHSFSKSSSFSSSILKKKRKRCELKYSVIMLVLMSLELCPFYNFTSYREKYSYLESTMNISPFRYFCLSDWKLIVFSIPPPFHHCAQLNLLYTPIFSMFSLLTFT